MTQPDPSKDETSKEGQSEVLDLTAALLRYASTTPDCKEVLDFVQTWLEGLGFVCTRIPAQSHSYAVDNLYARYGNQEPLFGFCGHVDVVPIGQEQDWTYPPFSAQHEQGKLFARGAVDMKSGLACFMIAVKRFLAKNKGFQGSLAFLITGDEESEAVAGTVAILRWMQDNQQIMQHCLVGEPSSREVLGDTIKIGRRGSFNATLTVTGQQGHVAYPEQFVNPNHQLIKLLYALQDMPLDQGSDHFDASSLQVTSIDVGNGATNVIPRTASARFNIRYNDHWTAQSLADYLHETISAFGFDYSLEWRSSGSSFVYPPEDFAALIAQSVEHITQQSPAFLTNGGTSDARFIAAHCPVAEFGLVGSSMHQVDEHVEIAQLEPLTACYQDIIERYFSLKAS